jgi:hypothetical protein
MPTEHYKGKDFLAYALGYGQKLGFRVIPLVPGKKTPLIQNWQNEGTWDEAKIREWWRRWPDANIGILTGRYRDGYFIVLDFDPRNGGDWFDDVGEDVLPPTWVVHTPNKGRHFYYGTTELYRCEKLPDGVDLRGEGGYVVAPPSVLIDDEKGFVGEWGFQIGNMPKDMGLAVRSQADIVRLRRSESGLWVLGGAGVGDAAKKTGDAAGGANGRPPLWLMPPPIPKGMRHDYLVSFAGALWSAGLSKEEVEKVLWRALELLETLDDFDPVKEIGNIIKGLEKWEGATYTLGSLLRMLPERSAGVVRQVLMAGMVSGEPKGEATGEIVSEPVSEPAGTSVSLPVSEAVVDTGQSERGRGGGAGRLSLAADIVGKLQVRKGEAGVYRYVYRAADGTELEAACAPEGVRELLAKLGLKIPLKDVKRLLGIAQEADGGEMGAGEAKEKKGRKSKAANKDDIKAVLCRYKWVLWQGELWQVAKPKILKADLDRLHGILKENGLDVGKDTLKSHYADIMTDIPKDPLEGIVVTTEPTYGRVGKLRGLWFCHRGDLYLITPSEVRCFAAGHWPEGVYALDLGMQGVLPDWDGTIEQLLIYWKGVTTRLKCNPKVALAMFLPVLFGQGHIGLILRGAARSGKSTLSKALSYLRLGRETGTPNGGANIRDLIAVLQREQIVFFDEVNTFSPELQETLKRMITHDKSLVRALYTDRTKLESDLRGSAIFCTTSLEKLAPDLRTRCFVWDLEEKGGSQYEEEIQIFCERLWRKALGGAIKLYQQAARLKKPPADLLPAIRFRDWLGWAYRYAVLLEVEKEFLAFVGKSKSAAHIGTKYDFLIGLLARPDFDTSREYTVSELLELAAPVSQEARGLPRAIGKESVRAELIAMARDMGYNLTIEKRRNTGDTKSINRLIFTRLQTSGISGYLRELLIQAGVSPDFDEDDDEPPPPETIRATPTPPDNTGAGAHGGCAVAMAADVDAAKAPDAETGADAAQDETKNLLDMEKEKKVVPSQLEAEARAMANGRNDPPPEAVGGNQMRAASTSAQPTKTNPKKAPPPSEWVYRAGTTPKNSNGGISDGLFAPPQNAQSKPTPSTTANPQKTAQDDEYPNDDEVIEFIEEQLKLHAEHNLSLQTSLDWLRGFLMLHELKMWEFGLKRSYFHIVNREIEIQDAINALGYDELTPERDPRLRAPKN